MLLMTDKQKDPKMNDHEMGIALSGSVIEKDNRFKST
jgi:hypothetical protein